jgi:hypothetical protein
VAVTTEPEEAFADFKSLVRIHLKQMLTLDRKPPMATVALLVSVACEQVSHLFPSEGSPEDVFSKALIEPHGVGAAVGRAVRRHQERPRPLVPAQDAGVRIRSAAPFF